MAARLASRDTGLIQCYEMGMAREEDGCRSVVFRGRAVDEKYIG